MSTKKLLLLLGVAGMTVSAALAQEAENFPPEYKDAYEGAIQKFYQNDFDGALSQLDAADKIKAGVTAAQNLRGAVYVRQKKYDEAQKVFAALYEKDPENVMAVFNLGETYFLQKNYAAALKHFQTFVDKKPPQQSLGAYKVFLCQMMTDQADEVKKTLSATMPSPTDPLYYYLNAAWLFKQEKNGEARSYLESAFQIYPGQANMAFIDSLIELGYVNPDEIKTTSGAAAPAETPAKTAAPAATVPDISGLDALLPSLEDGKKK